MLKETLLMCHVLHYTSCLCLFPSLFSVFTCVSFVNWSLCIQSICLTLSVVCSTMQSCVYSLCLISVPAYCLQVVAQPALMHSGDIRKYPLNNHVGHKVVAVHDLTVILGGGGGLRCSYRPVASVWDPWILLRRLWDNFQVWLRWQITYFYNVKSRYLQPWLCQSNQVIMSTVWPNEKKRKLNQKKCENIVDL